MTRAAQGVCCRKMTLSSHGSWPLKGHCRCTTRSSNVRRHRRRSHAQHSNRRQWHLHPRDSWSVSSFSITPNVSRQSLAHAFSPTFVAWSCGAVLQAIRESKVDACAARRHIVLCELLSERLLVSQRGARESRAEHRHRSRLLSLQYRTPLVCAFTCFVRCELSGCVRVRYCDAMPRSMLIHRA